MVLSGFQRRKDDQASFLFVVAGQVVKIILLRENIGLRELFASIEASENNGSASLSSEARSAGCVLAGGFAFAALLGLKAAR